MQSVDQLLAGSCGQVRPIELTVAHLQRQSVSRFVIDKPWAIIGRNSGCDIALDHDDITRQHVYLQILDGRLFCIDMASRSGIFWKDRPRLYGWLDVGEWLQIGPYRITLQQPVGEPNCPAQGKRNTAPFLNRYAVPPGTEAQLSMDDSIAMDLSSQIAIIGRSNYCNLELDEEAVSRFHTSIVRTRDGKHWLLDLHSRTGVRLNGKRCHLARLHDDDVIMVGSYSIQFRLAPERMAEPETLPDAAGAMLLEDSDETPLPTRHDLDLPAPQSPPEKPMQALVLRQRSEMAVPRQPKSGEVIMAKVARPAALAKPGPARKSGVAKYDPPHARVSRSPGELRHDWAAPMHYGENHVVNDMMQQMRQMQQEMFDQMRMNMEMMAQFMGNLQKQQMQMIREELAQLGKLNAELIQLKQNLMTAPPQQPSAPASREEPLVRAATEAKTPAKASPSETNGRKPAKPAKTETPPTPAAQPQSGSQSSHLWITRRIAVLEKERKSRWEKVKSVMMGG